ncbi:uncharacterized protein LOC113003277 [Solenopsis invicta]|uniref:uncharacterized protein LOC113003277 n=1 Tax=Solenopsis invicta TaxID=13686 RepID=UPI00193CF68F|nr:uncharacterized protein LOC113003277 [Solenopsis invicta]
MELLQFFTTAILLLSTASAKTSVPYQSIQLAFSITPQLMYTSESNPAFSGYSYTTQDFNGGESNVIFTTGADSVSKLKAEINSMKMPEYSQSDKNQKDIISSEQKSKAEKAEENRNKHDLDTNIKVINKEKKFSKNPKEDNLLEYQTNLQQVSLVDGSYSIFAENLLNLPVFPRYQISSNVIQNQYYPHNSYASLELPLHNFDFYNPTVPLFYQATTIIPDSNSKLASTIDKNMKASMESHVVKNSQTKVTSSESNMTKSNIIESRFNLESTTNKIEETPSSQTTIPTKKLETMITSEKNREEIESSSEPIKISQNTVEQTTDNKANSTELTSTEMSPLKEKSSTTTSKS